MHWMKDSGLGLRVLIIGYEFSAVRKQSSRDPCVLVPGFLPEIAAQIRCHP